MPNLNAPQILYTYILYAVLVSHVNIGVDSKKLFSQNLTPLIIARYEKGKIGKELEPPPPPHKLHFRYILLRS